MGLLAGKAGNLWKIWINDVNHGRKPYGGVTVAVYDYDVPFALAITMIDMHLGHATRAASRATFFRPAIPFSSCGERQ